MKILKIKSIFYTTCFTTLLTISLNNNSSAAGFATDLYSTSGVANSYAGSVTGIHDISDSFTNPATLSNVKNSELVVSVNYIDVDIDDDNTTGTNGALFGSTAVQGSRNNDAGIDNAIIPAFYYAKRLNDKTTLAFGLTSPFGLSTKYDANWIGRHQAIESEIQTVNANPSMSYEINNKLSVGAGLQAQYIKAVLTKAAFDGTNDHLGKLKGDDFGYGFNLGANYKLTDKIKTGVGYRSKIKHKLEGTGEIKGLSQYSDVTVGLTTPEILTMGASYDLSNKIELATDISWTRWSRIKVMDVVASNSSLINGDDLALNFKDSWRYALGLNYQLNDDFKIRTGTAYEEGASSSSEYTSPRLPIGDKIWATLGFEYKINEDFKIDAAYVHQFYKKTSTNIKAGTLTSGLNTEYKINSDVVSLGFGLNF